MRRLVAAVGCLAACAASPLARAQSAPRAWEVRTSPAAELWYHGLAVIGLQGPGPLPFYSDDYAAAVRADKRARGIMRTRLERNASAIRTVFSQDSTFESLHFLPLYSSGDDRARLLAAVRASVTGQGASAIRGASSDAALVATLSRVFASPVQRAALMQFVDALDEEWHVYLRDALARRAVATRAAIARADAQWAHDLAPALSNYLDEMGIHHGIILLSPSVGLEGRLRHADGRATVVVHWSPDDSAGTLPLLSAVRELCFPLVQIAVAAATSGTSTSRFILNDMSSRAGVQCGALMLDQAAPGMAASYRTLFAGSSGNDDVARRFESRFRLVPDLDHTLRAELARAMSGARASRR